MRVRQILLTYFNRRYNDTKFVKALDEEWLKHRWELFETFTIPSVAAQTCADFDWVILCHRDSPQWLYDRFQALDVPCRLRVSFDVLDPGFQDLDAGLADLRDPSYDVILTLNLDSDDGLHRCAMERVREAFEADKAEHEALFLDIGYKYDRFSQRLVFAKFASSPFVAKVNLPPFANPLDVGGNHARIISKYTYCEISYGDPLFLQVIHQRNVSNRVDSKQSSFLSKSLSRHVLRQAFHIEDSEQPFSMESYVSKLEQQTRPIRHKVGRVKQRILARLLGGSRVA
jgi:hypothetical protein